MSKHWFRGKGASWSAKPPCGVQVVFYGAKTADARELACMRVAAMTCAGNIRRAVPQASVSVTYVKSADPEYQDRTAAIVDASVTGDDLGAFDGGPTHRKALNALARASHYEGCGWVGGQR